MNDKSPAKILNQGSIWGIMALVILLPMQKRRLAKERKGKRVMTRPVE
jgi:hypothetical protein